MWLKGLEQVGFSVVGLSGFGVTFCRLFCLDGAECAGFCDFALGCSGFRSGFGLSGVGACSLRRIVLAKASGFYGLQLKVESV